jgi:hypothetical protein
MWILLLTCLALPIVSGCGPSGKAAKLIGSWKLDIGIANITLTYSKDYTYVAKMSGIANGSENGEWSVSGDRLTSKSKSSTIAAEDIGKEDVATIEKLDDTVLVIRSKDKQGKEQTMTFQRVRQ